MSVQSWMLDPATRQLEAPALIEGLAARLGATVPLARISTSLRTMHPEIYVDNLNWTREGVVRRSIPASMVRDDAFLRSPLARLDEGCTELFSDLTDGDYPLFDELRESGHTGYALFAAVAAMPTFVSFATDAEGGFTEVHIAELRACIPLLSVLLEIGRAHV